MLFSPFLSPKAKGPKAKPRVSRRIARFGATHISAICAMRGFLAAVLFVLTAHCPRTGLGRSWADAAGVVGRAGEGVLSSRGAEAGIYGIEPPPASPHSSRSVQSAAQQLSGASAAPQDGRSGSGESKFWYTR